MPDVAAWAGATGASELPSVAVDVPAPPSCGLLLAS